MDFNVIMVCGTVGRDPETKHTSDGKPVCTFSVAVNGYAKKVTWFNVATFGKQAETCQQYVKKGSFLKLVRGSMDEKKWKAKDGSDKSAWVLNANEVVFGDKPKGERVEEVKEDDIPF